MPLDRIRSTRSRSRLVFMVLTAGAFAAQGFHPTLAQPAGPLALEKGERIAIVGNTLADRMQHDGWLETLIQSRFPAGEISLRDLGYSGDEITLRLRSANFGSPDDWLKRTRASVVIAFFGSNEAYGDLKAFGNDLGDYIKHLKSEKFDGKAAPKIVICSPIAHEDLRSPHLPSGAEHNARLRAATAVMREVADREGVRFVDLFTPTQSAYAKAPRPLTTNGIHLNAEGNRVVAEAVDAALFGKPPVRDEQALERIRTAVLDKNFFWFNRYRTVDGYSIYGGRADLAFVDGQTNRVVAQREMEILDVMTANRDKRIQAVAAGKDLVVDDSNTPPFIPVKTNKPGAGPNGAHIFLDGGDESIAKMTVGKGLAINLFASEKEFPDLAKPVQMSFDSKGRLWVAVWPSYPHWKPKDAMNDKIIILEDTDGDGKADKETVFADKLHCPTGFELYGGGAFVAQAPDIMFLKDVNGDDRADIRERVLSGLDSADTHHTSNSFRLDPGGALYFQEGTFHHTQVETPYGPPVRNANAGVYRYEPRSQKFEAYVSFPFANPHGHSFDRWGQDFVTDGTGNTNYYATAFSGHVDYPDKHRGLRPFLNNQGIRPCPGTEVLSSRHFPDDFQGNYLVANVIGFQGILRYRVREEDSGFVADRLEDIVASSDPNFRPSDLETGPDGALYFIEWQNPIIGHMQHNLRDPSRDQTHGRVYRVTYKGRPLLKPATLAGLPTPTVLDLLKSPEDRERYRAKIELSARDEKEVMSALDAWIAALDQADPEFEHHRLEALWVRQFFDHADVPLLSSVLGSPNYRARAAAVRVLCYWRDKVPGAIELLKKMAADPYPRVRLEAVRAASFFTDPAAIEIVLISAEKPSDYYLDYTRGESLRTLEPYWKKAVAAGKSIAFTSDAGARFFLKDVATAELLKLKPNRGVDLEILFRKGVLEDRRESALAHLSAEAKSTPAQALLKALASRDAGEGDYDESVTPELLRLFTSRPISELAKVRPDLEKLAASGARSITRQFAYAAMIAADKQVAPAWELALKSAGSLADLLDAMPLIQDPAMRLALYPKIRPLLDAQPAGLGDAKSTAGLLGRYVRIELPGPSRTLTLAEVMVRVRGRNVARRGKASQSSTAYGGAAARAIDGRTDGAFGGNTSTHTEEGVENPWWEVDLGDPAPIDAIVIYNRTDGDLGKRLDGFTLKVLDFRRQPVYVKTDIPAPERSVEIKPQTQSPATIVRAAAMKALTYIDSEQRSTFLALAKFIREGVDRPAAIEAMRRIAKPNWSAAEAKPLLESLIGYVKEIPANERTGGNALAALELGDSLASLLDRDESRAMRKRLSELGVRVIRVGTVMEQMRYDIDRAAVSAGKTVEILFENNDLMPHNFVITVPGALEEIGLLAEATATAPDALSRQYVPSSNKILIASRLVQPREAAKLSFQAPSQPGIYPFVCTYPGHWRRMYGSLYVVADLDQYLADPEGYLAKNPLPIKDELLKFNRPAKEWKIADLASSVSNLAPGRSFKSAQKLFEVTSCSACHKLNGTGSEVGPNLAQLDAKKAPLDILKSVLEPSAEIEEKFSVYAFELDSGQVTSGMILEETPDTVKVIENPLAKAEPKVLAKKEIVERRKSPTSLMPKGLLDKLTEQEALDLLSYIIARGNAKHPLFEGGDHAHGH